MSMNIHIYAKREVIVTATGEKDFQWKRFDAWQTPTNVSYAIANSDNPVESYIGWVKSIGKGLIREVPVYAEDDIFGERNPLRYETCDPAQEHIDDLNEWIDHVKSQHYEVILEVL